MHLFSVKILFDAYLILDFLLMKIIRCQRNKLTKHCSATLSNTWVYLGGHLSGE